MVIDALNIKFAKGQRPSSDSFVLGVFATRLMETTQIIKNPVGINNMWAPMLNMGFGQL